MRIDLTGIVHQSDGEARGDLDLFVVLATDLPMVRRTIIILLKLVFAVNWLLFCVGGSR